MSFLSQSGAELTGFTDSQSIAYSALPSFTGVFEKSSWIMPMESQAWHWKNEKHDDSHKQYHWDKACLQTQWIRKTPYWSAYSTGLEPIGTSGPFRPKTEYRLTWNVHWPPLFPVSATYTAPKTERYGSLGFFVVRSLVKHICQGQNYAVRILDIGSALAAFNYTKIALAKIAFLDALLQRSFFYCYYFLWALFKI